MILKGFQSKVQRMWKSTNAFSPAPLAHAFSELALLLKSISLPHCLPPFSLFAFPLPLSKHSEDLFLIRIHPRNHVAQQAPAAPDSIKCLIQFYNMVFI